MADKVSKDWNGAVVRTWLESRIVAARGDQVVAEKGGWERQDDCDKANAEEMVCRSMKTKKSVDDQAAFLADLAVLLKKDEYICAGVYNDTRFDRHVRAYLKKLRKMAKLNSGFENVAHYQ